MSREILLQSQKLLHLLEQGDRSTLLSIPNRVKFMEGLKYLATPKCTICNDAGRVRDGMNSDFEDCACRHRKA